MNKIQLDRATTRKWMIAYAQSIGFVLKDNDELEYCVKDNMLPQDVYVFVVTIKPGISLNAIQGDTISVMLSDLDK